MKLFSIVPFDMVRWVGDDTDELKTGDIVEVLAINWDPVLTADGDRLNSTCVVRFPDTERQVNRVDPKHLQVVCSWIDVVSEPVCQA